MYTIVAILVGMIGARSGVADFIATLLETLTMINVTNTSVTLREVCLRSNGVGQDAVRNASIQTKRVYAAFRPLPIVKDRVKLTRYVNNRWITTSKSFHVRGGDFCACQRHY